MFLIIPAIDLRDGHCVRRQDEQYGADADYFDDPVQMAKLWRVQNARVLHLTDHDAEASAEGRTTNHDTIRAIAEALDIPVEVKGGVRTVDDVDALLDAGAYRVVLDPAADPDAAEAAVAKHSCSRVVAALDAHPGDVDAALDLERRGVRRILYTAATPEGIDIEAFRTLGAALGRTRLTAAGGVTDYGDLLRLQELRPFGVDSAIIGRALYENRFPCQQLWCWHDKDDVDLDHFSSARLADDGCD
ncbi:MAG: HisA/HisF-related TIM barrel protein [Bacteroidota bacterium]